MLQPETSITASYSKLDSWTGVSCRVVHAGFERTHNAAKDDLEILIFLLYFLSAGIIGRNHQAQLPQDSLFFFKL